MKKYLLVVLALILLAGCSATTTRTEDANTSDTSQVESETTVKKIGVILPLSGDAAAYGEEVKAVLDFRTAEMDNIELIYEDGKCDSAPAVTALQKLNSIDDVNYILGGFCSSETLAIANQLEGLNVLAISLGSSNPDIEGLSPNQYSLSYKDSDVGEGIVNQLKVYEKVAIISEQNDFNIGLKTIVEEALGDKIIVNEVFETTTTDLRNIIEKVKNSDAEAVFLNPYPGETTITLVTQIEELGGLTNMDLFGQVAFVSEAFLENHGTSFEGLVALDAPSIQNDNAQAFLNSLKEAGIERPNLGDYYSLSASDALDILVQLMEENSTVEESVAALPTQTFSDLLLSPELSFGGHSFVQGIGVSKFVITDGKAVRQ